VLFKQIDLVKKNCKIYNQNICKMVWVDKCILFHYCCVRVWRFHWYCDQSEVIWISLLSFHLFIYLFSFSLYWCWVQ